MRRVLFNLSVLLSAAVGISLISCERGVEPIDPSSNPSDTTDNVNPAVSVILNVDEAEILVGQTLKIEAVVVPSDADNTEVSYSSSNEAVATVNHTGLVTGVSAGTAIILAECGEVAATCDVTVVEPQKPRVGDFFYSDGTWSAKFDSGKQPIGIVFWTGDPTEQDNLLKRDYPACTHGLVVSLDEVLTPWQANWNEFIIANGADPDNGDWDYYRWYWISERTDEFTCTIAFADETHEYYENQQNIRGYNNTKAYEYFNAAPENAEWPVDIVNSCFEYRKSVAAPSNTSDWYVPSTKEVSLLITGEFNGNIHDDIDENSDGDLTKNMMIINKSLDEVNGTPIYTKSEYYWTSSERWKEVNDNAVDAWWVYVPMITHATPSIADYAVRFVLAF